MTIRFTFTTVVLPGHEADYDEVHRDIPDNLAQVIRAAGTRSWRIERDGSLLTHFIEVDDIVRFDEVLDASDVHARWQLVVAPLLEPGASPRTVVDHFDFGRGKLVWELPAAS